MAKSSMSPERSSRAGQRWEAVSSPSLEAFKQGFYNHLVGMLRRLLRHLIGPDETVVEGFLVLHFYDPLQSRSYSSVRLQVLKHS